MTTPPKTEIERLQDEVSNLRRDLCNALMQSRRKSEVIELSGDALKYAAWLNNSYSSVFEEKLKKALTAIAALSEKDGE